EFVCADDMMVTIIIPAYNAEEQISIAIDSLCRQTWQNLEILVVDDFSTDGTSEAVFGWSQKDNRVKLLRLPENGGTYAARNAALRVARGDLITVHDSDDWSH